ncbi:hypothetical protein U1Q18_003431 [Sarracenia purpurea var. burkii]
MYTAWANPSVLFCSIGGVNVCVTIKDIEQPLFLDLPTHTPVGDPFPSSLTIRSIEEDMCDEKAIRISLALVDVTYTTHFDSSVSPPPPVVNSPLVSSPLVLVMSREPLSEGSEGLDAMRRELVAIRA